MQPNFSFKYFEQQLLLCLCAWPPQQLTLSPGVPGVPFWPGSPFAPLLPSSPGGPGAPGVPFSPWQQQQKSPAMKFKSPKKAQNIKCCMGNDSGFQLPWKKFPNAFKNHLHARLLRLVLLLHHPYQVLPKQQKTPLKLWIATGYYFQSYQMY